MLKLNQGEPMTATNSQPDSFAAQYAADLATAEAVMGRHNACSFCGDPHNDTYWSGADSDIYACRACAVRKLAQLMADALVGDRHPGRATFEQVEEEFRQAQIHFWKAAADRFCLNGGKHG
jgi:hypothetical protein